MTLTPLPSTPWLERRFDLGQPPGNIGFILERLRGLTARLAQLLAVVPENTLEYRLHDKWSVKEQIGHLMDLDRLTHRRLDELLAGQATLSQASFRLEGDYNNWPLEKLLQQLATQRSALVKAFVTLKPEDYARSAQHPRLNCPFTAVDLAYFDAEHDDHHLFSMRSILETLHQTPA